MIVETLEDSIGFFENDDGSAFYEAVTAAAAADPETARRRHRLATERRGGLHAVAGKSALAIFGMGLRDLDREAATTMPSRTRLEAAYDAIRTVAGYDPDHATIENGIGFARSDVALGHALASAPASAAIGSPGMALLVWRLAMRYRRQVPPRLTFAAGISDQDDLFD